MPGALSVLKGIRAAAGGESVKEGSHWDSWTSALSEAKLPQLSIQARAQKILCFCGLVRAELPLCDVYYSVTALFAILSGARDTEDEASGGSRLRLSVPWPWEHNRSFIASNLQTCHSHPWFCLSLLAALSNVWPYGSVEAPDKHLKKGSSNDFITLLKCSIKIICCNFLQQGKCCWKYDSGSSGL